MNTSQRGLIVLVLIASVMMSGCGAGQAFGPTVTATATRVPTMTPTLIPTRAPTRDPMKDAPDGATGKDVRGFYQEVLIHGKPEKYYYKEYKDDHGEVFYTGYICSHVEGGLMELGAGLPLRRNGDLRGQPADDPDFMAMRIEVSADIADLVPTFVQVPRLNDWTKLNTTQELITILDRVYKLQQPLNKSQTLAELMYEGIYAQKPDYNTFRITTPDGVDHAYKLSRGYRFLWLSKEDLEKKFPDHFETSDTKNHDTKYYWTITVDSLGTATVIGAVDDPTALEDMEIAEFMLTSLEMIYEHRSVSSDEFEFFEVPYWPSALAGSQRDPDAALFSIVR